MNQKGPSGGSFTTIDNLTYNYESQSNRLSGVADALTANDPVVGEVFKGRKEIKKYFDSYFIGYNTRTELVSLDLINNTQALIEVKFSGNFSEGNIDGFFDVTFKNGKIAFVKADLIH